MESEETEDLSPRLKVRYDPSGLYYDMTGDRLMLIFTHGSFQKTQTSRSSQRRRPDMDGARLRKTFESLGFLVEEPYCDLTYDEVVQTLHDFSEMDHRTTSCVAFALLTEGDACGTVHASDRPYLLSDVIDKVLHASELAGKPKLFFSPVTSPVSEPILSEISEGWYVQSSNVAMETYVGVPQELIAVL